MANKKKKQKKGGSSGASLDITKKASSFSSNWKALQKELRLPKKKKKEQPEEQESKDVWFDDVDPTLIHGEKVTSGGVSAVAMDCEMVEVADMESESIVARVSLVNHSCECIYDKYVKPSEEVTDFRTPVSGIRASDIAAGEDFAVVQKEVADLIRGQLLVGHALKNDLKVLFLTHPKNKIRDTSKYKPFRALVSGKTPSLKKLAKQLLGTDIQTGEHNSVVDAQAAMRLYAMHRRQWEAEIVKKKKKRPSKR